MTGAGTLQGSVETILRLLYPFCPYNLRTVAALDRDAASIGLSWPVLTASSSRKKDNDPLQINGRLRDTFEADRDLSKRGQGDRLCARKGAKHIEGKTVRKTIVIPNKLVTLCAMMRARRRPDGRPYEKERCEGSYCAVPQFSFSWQAHAGSVIGGRHPRGRYLVDLHIKFKTRPLIQHSPAVTDSFAKELLMTGLFTSPVKYGRVYQGRYQTITTAERPGHRRYRH